MPAKTEDTPQEIDVAAIRFATIGRLVDRSRAMSIRKGARVVPEEEAANMPRQAAASSAQGRDGTSVPQPPPSCRRYSAISLSQCRSAAGLS